LTAALAAILNPVRTLIRFVLWTWFLAALAAGRFGLLQTLPAPALSRLLLGLTALVLGACFGIPSVRAWLRTVDLRVLILLHVSRLIAYAFLIFFRRGWLPDALAVPGGWGEVLVGALALAIVVLPMRAPLQRHAFVIWNTIGLFNVLLLSATFVRLGFVQPWQITGFRLLPCSMFPTFLIPLIIATHLVIYDLSRVPPGTPDGPAAPPAEA
jgi:hypothetical protein